MSKSKTGALVKDQGSLLAESEGKVAGMTAKGIIKMSEYSVSRDPVILDTKNGVVLTPDGERVVLVYYVGNGQIDLEGLRDAARQALAFHHASPGSLVRVEGNGINLKTLRVIGLVKRQQDILVEHLLGGVLGLPEIDDNNLRVQVADPHFLPIDGGQLRVRKTSLAGGVQLLLQGKEVESPLDLVPEYKYFFFVHRLLHQDKILHMQIHF